MKFTTRFASAAVVVSACGSLWAGCSQAELPTAASSATDVVMTAGGITSTGEAVLSQSVKSHRSGSLQIVKECTDYDGTAGSFCTILSSTIPGIDAGARIVYLSAPAASGLDTDIVIDPPQPGNNRVFGHCTLNPAAATGICTLSGGTGRFKWLTAEAAVRFPESPSDITWEWDGTFAFGARD